MKKTITKSKNGLKFSLFAVFVILIILFFLPSVNADDVCINPGALRVYVCQEGTSVDESTCCPSDPAYNYPNSPKTPAECKSNFYIRDVNALSDVPQCSSVCCCPSGELVADAECVGIKNPATKTAEECKSSCGAAIKSYPPASGCKTGDANFITKPLMPSAFEVIPQTAKKQFKLKWFDSCISNAQSYEIKRCTDSSCSIATTKTIAMLQPNTFEYIDNDPELKFNDISYSYRITAVYKDRPQDDVTSALHSLGSFECWNRKNNDNFCISEEYYRNSVYLNYINNVLKQSFEDFIKSTYFNGIDNRIASCNGDDDGLIKLKPSDTPASNNQLCMMVGGEPKYVPKTSDCYGSNNPFGLWSTKDNCEKEGTNPKTCFYDESQTVSNGCFSCESGMACYDYKTEGACGSDNCKISSCKWKSYDEDGIQKGVCVSTAKSNCDWCKRSGTGKTRNTEKLEVENSFDKTKVVGTTYISFNTLFDRCTKSKSEALSEGSYSCVFSDKGNSLDCDEAVCSDLNINQCTGNLNDNPCKLTGCKWKATDNKCIKDSDNDNTADCPGDRDCELDYFPPETTIIPKLNIKGFYDTLSISIMDKKSKLTPPVLISDSDKSYKTYFCASSSCSNKAEVKDRAVYIRIVEKGGIKTFVLKDVKGAEILTLGSTEGIYNLYYYSVDASKNPEGIKFVPIALYIHTSGPELKELVIDNNHYDYSSYYGKSGTENIYIKTKNPEILAVFKGESEATSSYLEEAGKPKKLPTVEQQSDKTKTKFSFAGLEEKSYSFVLDAKEIKEGVDIAMDNPCPAGGKLNNCPAQIVVDITSPKLNVKFAKDSTSPKTALADNINLGTDSQLTKVAASKTSSLYLSLEFEDANPVDVTSVILKKTDAIAPPSDKFISDSGIYYSKDNNKELNSVFAAAAPTGAVKPYGSLIEGLPDGSYELSVIGEDKAGNQVSKKISFTTAAFPDTTPPAISYIFPNPNDVTPQTSPVISFKLTDIDSLVKKDSIKLKINNVPKTLSFTPDSDSKEITASYESRGELIIGENTITLGAEDTKGNKIPSGSSVWKFTINPNAVFANSVKIKATADIDISSGNVIIDDAKLKTIPPKPVFEAVFSVGVDGITEYKLEKKANSADASFTQLSLNPQSASGDGKTFSYVSNEQLSEGEYKFTIASSKVQGGTENGVRKEYIFYALPSKIEIFPLEPLRMTDNSYRQFFVKQAFIKNNFDFEIDTPAVCEIKGDDSNVLNQPKPTKPEDWAKVIIHSKDVKADGDCTVKLKSKNTGIVVGAINIRVVYDNKPPVISSHYPPNGAVIGNPFPIISAVIEDDSCLKDDGTVRNCVSLFTVDRLARTGLFDIQGGNKFKFSYDSSTSRDTSLDNPFKINERTYGKKYSVLVKADDSRGNSATSNWEFTIDKRVLNPEKARLSQSSSFTSATEIQDANTNKIINFNNPYVELTYKEDVEEAEIKLNKCSDALCSAPASVSGAAINNYEKNPKTKRYSLSGLQNDGYYELEVSTTKNAGDSYRGNMKYYFRVITSSQVAYEPKFVTLYDTSTQITTTHLLISKFKYEPKSTGICGINTALESSFTLKTTQVGKCVIGVKDETGFELLPALEIDILPTQPPAVSIRKEGECNINNNVKIICNAKSYPPNSLKQIDFYVGLCEKMDLTLTEPWKCFENRIWDDLDKTKGNGIVHKRIAGSSSDGDRTFTYSIPNLMTDDLGNAYLLSGSWALTAACTAEDNSGSKSLVWGDAYPLCIISDTNCQSTPLFKIKGIKEEGGATYVSFSSGLGRKTYVIEFEYVPSTNGKTLASESPAVFLRHKIKGTSNQYNNIKLNPVSAGGDRGNMYTAEFTINSDNDEVETLIVVSGKESGASDNCIGSATISFLLDNTPPLITALYPKKSLPSSPLEAVPLAEPFVISISAIDSSGIDLGRLTLEINGNKYVYSAISSGVSLTYNPATETSEIKITLPPTAKLWTAEEENVVTRTGKEKGQNDISVEIFDAKGNKANIADTTWSFVIDSGILMPKSAKLLGTGGRIDDITSVNKIIDKATISSYNTNNKFIELVFAKEFSGLVELYKDGSILNSYATAYSTSTSGTDIKKFYQITAALTEGNYIIAVKKDVNSPILKQFYFRVVENDIQFTPSSLEVGSQAEYCVSHNALKNFKFESPSANCAFSNYMPPSPPAESRCFKIEGKQQGACTIQIKDMFDASWTHSPLSIQVSPQSALSVYVDQTKIYSGIDKTGASSAIKEDVSHAKIIYTNINKPVIAVYFNRKAEIINAEIVSSSGVKFQPKIPAKFPSQSTAVSPFESLFQFDNNGAAFDDGRYTFNLYAVGNTNALYTAQIEIDTTKPSSLSVKAGKNSKELLADSPVMLLQSDVETVANSRKSKVALKIEVTEKNEVEIAEATLNINGATTDLKSKLKSSVSGTGTAFATESGKELELDEGDYSLRISLKDIAGNFYTIISGNPPVAKTTFDYLFVLNAYPPGITMTKPKYGFVREGEPMSVEITTDRNARCGYLINTGITDSVKLLGVTKLAQFEQGAASTATHTKTFTNDVSDFEPHIFYVKCDESATDSEERSDSVVFAIGRIQNTPAFSIERAEASPSTIVEKVNGAQFSVATNKNSICKYTAETPDSGESQGTFDGYSETLPPAVFGREHTRILNLLTASNGQKTFRIDCNDMAGYTATSSVSLTIDPNAYEVVDTTPDVFRSGEPIKLSARTNKDVPCFFRRKSPEPQITNNLMTKEIIGIGSYAHYARYNGVDDLRNIAKQTGGLKEIIESHTSSGRLSITYEVKCTG